MLIVPFRLHNTWLGLDLELVKVIASCGKMSLMPHVPAPVVGLMQKNGKILPIWSLFPMVNGKRDDVKQCIYYIETIVQKQSVALPAHEILPVVTVVNSWVPIFKYGLKLYRSLDKKTPSYVHDVQENISLREETPTEGFRLEEIY
ncbi:MAG: chemotaxis protein CheW [Brevinema sp.]